MRERERLRHKIKDKKTARVRDRVNYADWADGRPTVTVTIGADFRSGVLPSTAVSRLTRTHPHMRARTHTLHAKSFVILSSSLFYPGS